MAQLAFHRLAERELNEAAQYYELECPGHNLAHLIQPKPQTGRHPHLAVITSSGVQPTG